MAVGIELSHAAADDVMTVWT